MARKRPGRTEEAIAMRDARIVELLEEIDDLRFALANTRRGCKDMRIERDNARDQVRERDRRLGRQFGDIDSRVKHLEAVNDELHRIIRERDTLLAKMQIERITTT